MRVETKIGTVIGKREDNMYAFKSIPFTEPPVGDLRFRTPVPVKRYNNFEAFEYGHKAVQSPPAWYPPDTVYSEDCLHINIWTPNPDNKKRPVVFYIHGGGHAEGSNSDEGEWMDGTWLETRMWLWLRPTTGWMLWVICSWSMCWEKNMQHRATTAF